MLSLSQATGYAILALACLEGPGGVPLQVGYLARCTNLPKPYLSKIVQALAAKGFLKTKRGYKGGILLSWPPGRITLLEVVMAVEGPNWIGGCLLGTSKCWERRGCPVHRFWEKESRRIKAELRSWTLEDMRALQLRYPRMIAPARYRATA